MWNLRRQELAVGLVLFIVDTETVYTVTLVIHQVSWLDLILERLKGNIFFDGLHNQFWCLLDIYWDWMRSWGSSVTQFSVSCISAVKRRRHSWRHWLLISNYLNKMRSFMKHACAFGGAVQSVEICAPTTAVHDTKYYWFLQNCFTFMHHSLLLFIYFFQWGSYGLYWFRLESVLRKLQNRVPVLSDMERESLAELKKFDASLKVYSSKINTVRFSVTECKKIYVGNLSCTMPRAFMLLRTVSSHEFHSNAWINLGICRS